MGVLEDKFGVPPFSILDTKQGYWMRRKKEWGELGIDSELGRDARALNNKEWIEDKDKHGAEESDSGTSIFDPVLCELLYKWFCEPRGKILDPFAGGSVRGIVASVFGYDYNGVDLREEQVIANYNNISKLSVKLPIEPNWICGDSNNIKCIGGKYDFIMSCPPYHDLEKYSDKPEDLSNMNYSDFIKQYRNIIKQSISMLKNNRFAVFVVGEIRDNNGFYKGFVNDTTKAFIDGGMQHYNDIILFNQVNTLSMRVSKQFEPYRKIGKIHQNILVFYKGDPKSCQPMDMKANAFTPLKDMNIPPIERTEKAEMRIIGGNPQTLDCEVCGAVSKDQESYDAHLTRPFHMDMV